MEYQFNEYMQGYIANLKASEMWFHSAHHVAKGPGFVADHKDLYTKIYNQLGDHFDLLIEKSIALSGFEDVACPVRLSLATSRILKKRYTSPVNLSSEHIVALSIECIANLINSISSLYSKYKKHGYLTLGLEDSLTSMANVYEEYLYLLGQRYKN